MYTYVLYICIYIPPGRDMLGCTRMSTTIVMMMGATNTTMIQTMVHDEVEYPEAECHDGDEHHDDDDDEHYDD